MCISQRLFFFLQKVASSERTRLLIHIFQSNSFFSNILFILALKTPFLLPKILALTCEHLGLGLSKILSYGLFVIETLESWAKYYSLWQTLLMFLHQTLEKLQFPGAFWCSYVSGTKGSSVTGFDLGVSWKVGGGLQFVWNSSCLPPLYMET